MYMTITRRKALALLAGAFPAAHSRILAAGLPANDLDKGPFQPTRESLACYHVPDWFRHAKFGIFAHCGPQSAAEAGDWYARHMYIQGHEQYESHLNHYGLPSKMSFK